MRDPRIRLFVTASLSIAAYISVWGAGLALLWWLACSSRRIGTGPKAMAAILSVPAIVSLLIFLTGGDGISYLIRIGVILLIASWAYAERYPGDLLDLFVWLLGRKIGFDIGMAAEMSISALEVIGDDIRHVRIALVQKGEKIRAGILVPVTTYLLLRQLHLARERAAILALRGYTKGGAYTPSFAPTHQEILAGALSALILLLSAFTGDFFMVFNHIFTV